MKQGFAQEEVRVKPRCPELLVGPCCLYTECFFTQLCVLSPILPSMKRILPAPADRVLLGTWGEESVPEKASWLFNTLFALPDGAGNCVFAQAWCTCPCLRAAVIPRAQSGRRPARLSWAFRGKEGASG